MVLTTDDILKIQKELYEHGKSQALKKGNDYSGKSKDTFRNIRASKYMGIVQTDAQACMVQIMNKVSRMSNQSDPEHVTQVTDESIFDTVSDLWNYSSYWYLLMREAKTGLKPTEPWSKEDDKVFQRYWDAKVKAEATKVKIIHDKRKKWNKKKKTAPKRKTTETKPVKD